ncbi:uncharacterized protein LY79DRAFT_579480 [Colletotrichum navitas]|uniref:Uncharacterized protein n=1 Tax=Colletotrichum navitas TaxID=681940 RepID=A0AAD8Q0H3_9PEZI|nr:uncharacterized protein LY79DRAFT_579480 [Colletotrichum navitas]KAK1593110.1 hypothetical protein LY79DRAFT_579480 [Colletotrichum navitas]
MESVVVTLPGHLVETNTEADIIYEWPKDIAGNLNIVVFVVPLTILKLMTGIQKANTLLPWNLSDRIIIQTVIILDGSGIRNLKSIPGNYVAAIDILDLDNVKWPGEPNETQPIVGLRYVKIRPSKRRSY